MNPVLRRSVAFSALLHLLIILALLITLPVQKLPDSSGGTSFEVEFESAPKAPAHGPPAKYAPKPSPAPTQPQPPKVTQKIAPETAPPPPPPPAPAHAEAEQTVLTPSKPIPTPPQPVPSLEAAPTITARAKPAESPAPQASIPIPPEPVPAPPSPSNTSQPNKTTNAVNDSEALENTLAKLRSVTKDNQAPTAKANPESGGAAQESGNPNSDETNTLTAAERGAIGDAVRPCWTRDAGALNADKLQVMLQVTTDAAGVVRVVRVAPEDIDRVNGDPVLRAFSDRAVNALLDARCATLPLPQSMLGQPHQFSFRFSP